MSRDRIEKKAMTMSTSSERETKKMNESERLRAYPPQILKLSVSMKRLCFGISAWQPDIKRDT